MIWLLKYWKPVAILALLVAVFAGGWVACSKWNSPFETPVTEHGIIRGPGTQVTAARSATPAKPAQDIPKSAKVQDTFRATISGGKPVIKDNSKASKAEADHCSAIMQCPIVSIDGTLVRNNDGQQDLYLSTGGSLIQTAELHPSVPVILPAEHRQALGVTYLTGDRWGIIYERESGPVRLGVQIMQPMDGSTRPEAAVSAMWRFR